MLVNQLLINNAKIGLIFILASTCLLYTSDAADE